MCNIYSIWPVNKTVQQMVTVIRRDPPVEVIKLWWGFSNYRFSFNIRLHHDLSGSKYRRGDNWEINAAKNSRNPQV